MNIINRAVQRLGCLKIEGQLKDISISISGKDTCLLHMISTRFDKMLLKLSSTYFDNLLLHNKYSDVQNYCCIKYHNITVDLMIII